jgi:Mrp family chromosome partitioning ATPase
MLVVGWTDGCGATYVAVNLARVVARLGRRTVLVDGNLRRPCLHAVYGVSNDEGFIDALLDTDPAELTHSVEPPALSLMGAGPRPPVAEELLAAVRLGPSLERLEREHERVVIDGAPLHDGADSLLLAGHVDGVVVVVPSHVQVPELSLHLSELESLGLPLVGVVVGAV